MKYIYPVILGVSLVIVLGYVFGFYGPPEPLPEAQDNRLSLTKYVVQNAEERLAVCNDGTPAVYYHRPGTGDGIDKWVVWFRGGGGCGDFETCEKRWEEDRSLMSSASSRETLSPHGILSSDTTANPDFHNWNHVQLQYCSSDSWAGDAVQTKGDLTYYFYGTHIVRAMIEDMKDPSVFPEHNLSNASAVLVAGSSAGGFGAANNLDRIAAWLPDSDVRGVLDSSWYPPLPPYTSFSLLVTDVDFRNIQADETCFAGTNGDTSACTRQSTLYPYIETPVFIYMDQHDRTLITNAGISDIRDPEQKVWVDVAFRESLLDSFEQVDALFSPNTGMHTALTNNRFTDVRVDGMTFQEVLGNWYFNREGPVKVIE